ncbi:MFS transporter [Nonomuraea rhodomycinica]|uniref:MFS transporter n=1 Tax=Nonomuraea rhodomycinica TaxID=1712872 RepID=A0A7Y6MB34_9ACTN|nr:MFS transporter [Nonomuraea rhodomycinica]NUW41282.1 MFS transporter [Nonomuraea rhodomycinica]
MPSPARAAPAAPAAPAGADPAVTPARRRAVLAVVVAASVLDLLDSTITNIAAPTIAADLRGGDALVQWLGAGYALALGVLLVPGGRLGDKYGRRRTFLAGIAGFTLASVACGLAPDPASLITARLVQGAFGALLIPQGFGILTSVFPRDQLGTAFSAFLPALGGSAVGGPVLAAGLIEADLFGLGWRAMFLINIVLGGVIVLAAARLLPKDRGDASVSLDGPGAALLAAAMLGLLYGLIDGSAHGWAAAPLLCMAAGLAFFALFARRQRTAANPLIEPSLLRNRGFTSGLVLGAAYFAAVSGLLYVLSLFMQKGLGFTPLRASLGLAPVAAGIVVASVASHRLITRLGRRLVAAGLVVTLAGTGWLLALVLVSGTAPGGWALVAPVLVVGLGMGTCSGTVYVITVGDIDPAESGSAGGSLTAVQQLANAVGAAAVTTVYFGSLADGQAAAAARSLATTAVTTLLCCALVRLLPRRAAPRHH